MKPARIASRVCFATASLLVLLIVVLAVFAEPVHAAAISGERVAYSVAHDLMSKKRFKEAREILLILQRQHPDDRNIQISLAQADTALGNFNAAFRRLEDLADKQPDWPRPRVELAKAHAAAGNVRKGKAILVAELGKDPPPHVRRNIEAAIRRLEDKQSFVGRFSLGVAPDSNINNGSNADTVEYLGLPFTLNDDAKAQSGVRADVSTGGTLRTSWTRNTRLEMSLDLHHSEPLGDEGTPKSNVRLGFAARTRGPDGALAVGVTVRPFYADNELTRIERAVFVQPVRRITGRHYAVGSLTLTEGKINNSTARDFHQWEATAGPSIGFGDTGRLRLSGTYGRRNAGDNVYSFQRRGVSANVDASPWNGWRINLKGAVTNDVYEDFNYPFGRKQEDTTTEAGFSVTRTGWVFFGVSPRVGLRWRKTSSTIDLYDRDSVAFTAGLALPY